jgi:hypothetical protein
MFKSKLQKKVYRLITILAFKMTFMLQPRSRSTLHSNFKISFKPYTDC